MPFDRLRQDLRFVRRTAFAHPGFALTVVLTLAVGIAATTAIFTLLNAVLIRSLPFPDPDRLMVLWGNVQREVVERRGASFPDFRDWRAEGRSFIDLAAVWDANFTLQGGDESEWLSGEVVSPAYFPLLGIQAARGRVLEEDDDRPGVNAVVIGHGLWLRRFGGDPEIVGRPLRLSARTYTVVGVGPADFKGLTDRAEVWVPVGAVLEANAAAQRGSRWFAALGRLKPGTSREQAQVELDGISRALEQQYPDTNEKRGVEVSPLEVEMFGAIRPALIVGLAAAGLLLLIACANVANLLLAHAEGRQREMAIRAAVGASRFRIYRQLLTESLVYAALAGGCGLLLSQWATDALLAASPVTLPGFVRPDVDWTVLLFVTGISVAVGLAAGLAPAWQIRGEQLSGAIRESTARGTAGLRRHRVRQAIIVSEVALALLLLVGAGLLVRTLVALTSVDPGFRPDHLLSLRVSLPAIESADAARSDPARGAAGEPSTAAAASMTILERLRALPGVESASLGTSIPLVDSSAIFYTPEGHIDTAATSRPRAYVHRVTPGHFETLGVPLMRGRTFTEAEILNDARVVVISEEVARRFWPDQDPIGRRIKAGGPESDAPWLDVVGVVREARYRRLPRNPTPDPDLFGPFRPQARNFAVLVRTRLAPASMVSDIRQAIRGADPSATMFNVAPMSERVHQQLARPRFLGWLTAIFAGLALLLAAVGVYGVMAQSVRQRTKEIGIRMALGAGDRNILRDVFLRGLGLVAIGLCIGCLAAFASTRALRALLFGIEAADPLTFAGAAVVLVAAAAVAIWVPARHAMRVDPLTALRAE